MKKTDITEIYKSFSDFKDKTVTVGGWIRNLRSSKAIGFIELNDGTCFKPLQVVFEGTLNNFSQIESQNIGAAIIATGKIVETPGMRQPFEMQAEEIHIEGSSSPDYPLQNKRHSMEFLRTIAHLRPRTNTFNALYRVRSVAAFAIHKFFNERGFVYAHTPILTGSDAEGAGEMFRVTTLDPLNPPVDKQGKVDFSEDFFGKQASLTVSGQLEAECMATSFSKVYTFGPTFRAEKSFTPRHAAEFWMIEPEIAFADLEDDMQLACDMIKFIINYCLINCKAEIEFFNKFIDKGLMERLTKLVEDEFVKITYTKAIELLEKADVEFAYPVFWGCDLQTEHERYITEKVYNGPVFVTDYPADIKAFYMRQNDDGKTVAAMDLLVPGVGEIIGGSQREEREDKLIAAIKKFNLDAGDYNWYIDLRKFGSVKHAGFGLGFERLIMYLTGVQNIREVIPFPRTTGSLDF